MNVKLKARASPSKPNLVLKVSHDNIKPEENQFRMLRVKLVLKVHEKFDFPKVFEQWVENDIQFVKADSLFKSSHLQHATKNGEKLLEFRLSKGDSNMFKRNTPDFNEIHIVLNGGDLGDMLKYNKATKEFTGTLRLTKGVKKVTLGTITKTGQLRQLIQWHV